MKHKKIRKILIEFGKENNIFGTKDASHFLKNQRTLSGKRVNDYDVNCQVLGNLLSTHTSFEKIERKRTETIWKYRGDKNE